MLRAGTLYFCFLPLICDRGQSRVDDEAQRMWNYMRDIEVRLRTLEAHIAVLLAATQAAQARGNYLPGWIIAVIGLLVSILSVTASLWATGKTP